MWTSFENLTQVCQWYRQLSENDYESLVCWQNIEKVVKILNEAKLLKSSAVNMAYVPKSIARTFSHWEEKQ